LNHQWPRWAFGDRKIVYTVRAADVEDPAAPTDLMLMNADGSDPELISSFDFEIGQPQIDATGTTLFFTAAAPWFPDNAVFAMDLRSLESTNLTAVTTPLGGLNTDPMLSPDQRSLYLISGTEKYAPVVRIGIDGTAREEITRDTWWNTDPDVSPDGSFLAISSYRGPDTPSEGGLNARAQDFHLVLHHLADGGEQVLTEGLPCNKRPVTDPCSVSQMSAYTPRFSPDGRQVGFVGALDRRTTCICVMGLDGSDPHPAITSTALAISWFDQPHGDSADGWAAIGSARRASRVLVTMAEGDGSAATLVDASPDLMHRRVLPLPAGLEPVQARWSPDRSQVVFTARTHLPDRAAAAHPAPPQGESRREHVTLADLDPVALAQRAPPAAEDAELQVFLRAADGSVRALTDPWTEDWRDGLRAGDTRSNTDPAFTPDGRAVVVTNTSTLTGESFLLRIDLGTGTVLNLTNATSGAVPVDDRTAAVSPDGMRIAFTWRNGAVTDVYTMAADGAGVRAVTTTDAPDAQPIWLPGADAVVSVVDGADGPALVRTDVGTSAQQVLSAGVPGPVARPAAAPEGDRLLFLATSALSRTAWTTAATGGGPAAVLQPDPLHQYLDVDWR
jgi:Tol biopolymer transport system component